MATHRSALNPTNATLSLVMPLLRSDSMSLAHAAIARARAARAACQATHVILELASPLPRMTGADRVGADTGDTGDMRA